MIARSTPIGVNLNPVRPAAILTNGKAVSWLCPNCQAKLAEIVGSRVVVRSGDRRITMELRWQPTQDCPRCGCVSQVSEEAMAA